MIEEQGWISKQGPTPFDADEEGKILAQVSQGYIVPGLEPRYEVPHYAVSVNEYSNNDRLVRWKHTDSWLSTHEELSRQVCHISGCGDGSVVAIAKDGSLWKLGSEETYWRRLPNLPTVIRKVSNGI